MYTHFFVKHKKVVNNFKNLALSSIKLAHYFIPQKKEDEFSKTSCDPATFYGI